MSIYDEIRTKSGKSMSAFARDNGISRQALYASARGYCSRELRLLIADLLGKNPDKLFNYDDVPESYSYRQDNSEYIQAIDTLAFEKRYGVTK
jgi:transcriptional regulator with XRE-family HTH domain